ncbi:hypothetical protein Lal_00037819 [Lupinus albus]|nr:hypothetical protein Lal_00037819 [Lupinus albus]
MELGRLTLHAKSDKRKKGISLKASTSQNQEERFDDDSDFELDDETMMLLVQKFRKFLKRKGELKQFQKKEANGSTRKVENDKNTSRDFKTKKAHIMWDALDEESTTSTSEKEEMTKLCLMVNTQDSCSSNEHGGSSEVQSYESNSFSENYENSPTYQELYGTFVELHE